MVNFTELQGQRVNMDGGILSVSTIDPKSRLGDELVIVTVGNQRGFDVPDSTWKGVMLTKAQTQQLISLLESAIEE